MLPDQNRASRLAIAVLANDLEATRSALAKGSNPNMGIDGMPLLSLGALIDVDFSILQEMIRHGADPLRRHADRHYPGALYASDLAKNPTTSILLRKAEENAAYNKLLNSHSRPCLPFENFQGQELGFNARVIAEFEESEANSSISTEEYNPEQEKALYLLQMVLAHNLSAVEDILELDANANIGFDGIPLLAIAAAQNVPLAIIEELILCGADPEQPIAAPVYQSNHVAADVARNSEIRQYLRFWSKSNLGKLSGNLTMRLSQYEDFSLNQFPEVLFPAPLVEEEAATRRVMLDVSVDHIPNLLENRKDLLQLPVARSEYNPLATDLTRQLTKNFRPNA